MATISIEVNDAKVSLIVDAVREYKKDSTLTPAQCLVIVDDYLTSKLKTFVEDYQRRIFDRSFTFDDPTA